MLEVFENVKWLINQGVAIFVLLALLYLEYKRAGCLTRLPEEIRELKDEVEKLRDDMKK